MARSRVSPTGVTLSLSLVLAGLAAALLRVVTSGSLVGEDVPVLLLAAGVGVIFLLAEFFSLNIEFRRQTHSLTLAGVPLVLGVLLLPPWIFVLTRVTASVIAFALERKALQKSVYNVAAYAFECAVISVGLGALLPVPHALDIPLGATVITVVALVDQLMCCSVLLLIRLHGGPLSRRDVVGVLVPAAVVSVTATFFGFGALMLVRQGPFGIGVVTVLSCVGALAYAGHARTMRQHKSLSLVHEFVTLGTAASSLDGLAEQLVCRLRRLLRAESAEVALLDGPFSAASSVLVLAANEHDEVTIERRAVDQSDWVVVRALTDGEPMLAARDNKDPAVSRWLDARRLRDAVLVAFPSSTGLAGTVSVTNRLGETSTFTPDDRQLVQTLSGHLAVAIQRTRLVEQLGYDATHDALTGLHNRAHLSHRIDAVLADDNARAAVLLLDLDRFKEVNDALGHEVGDRLLLEVAQRLHDWLPPDATVARLGGDEFAMLLPDVGDRAVARALAHEIVDRLEAPVTFDEATLSPGASIGVALSGSDAGGTELLRQADTAMYEAKLSDVSVAVFDSDMDRGRVQRLALLADLRTALRERTDQFTLHYQPQMDLATGAITSVEALVRWNHPTLGTVAPDRFIPLAEATGLMNILTPLVLSSALADCARWQHEGHDIAVSVNLSARNVNEVDLPARVAAALQRSGVAADRLILEITESSVMGDPAQTLPILRALNSLGVCVSLDDFGTGYSSLSYLQQMPVAELKIDQSFVNLLGSENDAGGEALIRSITGLGGSLGLRVVAEGIEDPAMLAELGLLGCHVGQGYAISRPLPIRDLLTWLRGRRSTGSLSLVPAVS